MYKKDQIKTNISCIGLSKYCLPNYAHTWFCLHLIGELCSTSPIKEYFLRFLIIIGVRNNHSWSRGRFLFESTDCDCEDFKEDKNNLAKKTSL